MLVIKMDTQSRSERDGTGEYVSIEDKIVKCFHGKYIIHVRLTQNDEFVSIDEVTVNKDFIDYKQKITLLNYNDVKKYYDDE